MVWTTNQRRSANIAAAYGYKTAIRENTVAVNELAVGDGIIILTEKGEPIMSGQIEDIDMTDSNSPSVRVGGEWYCTRQYSFRRI